MAHFTFDNQSFAYNTGKLHFVSKIFYTGIPCRSLEGNLDACAHTQLLHWAMVCLRRLPLLAVDFSNWLEALKARVDPKPPVKELGSAGWVMPASLAKLSCESLEQVVIWGAPSL